MTEKFQRLLNILKEMQSAVLAFSGGVDSTFLLKAIKESGINALAVTAFSEIMPESDMRFAEDMAGLIGIRHKVIKTSELNNPEFVRNTVNRCFYCKDGLFTLLSEIADGEGYKFVIDGSNVDDLSDWRPGKKAAVKYGVRSPLVEAGFSKEEIRELSKVLDLPTWSKPASPCLSSRFPYGVEITKEGLKRVEQAEEFLKNLSFHELRVRSHNDTARIEVRTDEIDKLLGKGLREMIVIKLKELGFKHVAVDLEGFRSGKLNP
ncbi:MAG: TIGR00268 family protein [Thermodesulfovibrio sp.]|nr:TIGR00268 family protein [Thermodesulfovibrio sp.]